MVLDPCRAVILYDPVHDVQNGQVGHDEQKCFEHCRVPLFDGTVSLTSLAEEGEATVMCGILTSFVNIHHDHAQVPR